MSNIELYERLFFEANVDRIVSSSNKAKSMIIQLLEKLAKRKTTLPEIISLLKEITFTVKVEEEKKKAFLLLNHNFDS